MVAGRPELAAARSGSERSEGAAGSDGELGEGAGGDGGAPLIGVLAIQGGFEAHERMLLGLGARVRQVRVPADLEGIDGLVLPGGESTAIMLGLQREGLIQPLKRLVWGGLPVLGSCAGLILLDEDHLGLMDMRAARNAFGRQIHSFEADLEIAGIDGPPMRAVFIRAPWIERLGRDLEALAILDGHPVAARQGDLIAISFHSELTGDDRIHRMLLEAAARRACGEMSTL